ncbi:MAG TPA: hypothetical protein VFL95_10535, partial [Gemmatimonadales bacterium]|nr:hypothetical protein [Gemmatimonadales bacterium]
MSLEMVLDSFARTPGAVALQEQLPARGGTVRVGGVAGSSGAVLASWLVRSQPQRIVVVITPTPAEAERWLSDLGNLSDVAPVLYPQREALAEDESHYEIAGERVETIAGLLRGEVRLLVTTARASAERTLVPAALEALRLPLKPGLRMPPGQVVAALERMGYRRVPTVTEVAEFSVRGGIVDVYGFGMAAPARCEWWGDDIASLRAFDLTTQRSQEELGAVVVLPISTKAVRRTDGQTDGGSEPNRAAVSSASQSVSPSVPLSASRRTLLDLLPADAFVIEESAGPDADEVVRAWNEAAHHLAVARRQGDDAPDRDALFESPEEWCRRLAAFPRILLGEDPADVQLGFFPPERIDRDLG